MDVGKSIGAVGLQSVAGNEARDQAKQNATTQLQARYGEKQKEARPVKKQLDKDDFMRIMITEMKHQDPTKPMDADRMATQMAQVTSVEQLKNVSVAIEKLAEKSSASDRLAMSAMIGKSVTVDKGRFNHTKNTQSPINFNLPQDASKVKISVLDEHGEVVATRELEPKKAGMNVYNWDGINESNIQVPTGNYIVRVDAEDAKGAKMSVDPISKETVVGVSFDGGETNFLVGDTKSPQKVNFRNVVRIEGDAQTENAAQQLSQARTMGAQAKGQVPGGATGLPPELMERLKMSGNAGSNTAKPAPNAKAPSPVAGASPADVAGAMAAAEADKAPGFPNGLNE